MKNKTFLTTVFALILAFGGVVACRDVEVEREPIEPVTTEQEERLDELQLEKELEEQKVEVEVEEEKEELQDLEQKIEDPELMNPNVKFEENLTEY